MKSSDEQPNFDPHLANTATCKSAITSLNVERGELRYRGYAIQDLVATNAFLEVAYLLIFGEIPTIDQYQNWLVKIEHAGHPPSQLVVNFAGAETFARPIATMMSLLAAAAAVDPFELEHLNIAHYRSQRIAKLIGILPWISEQVSRSWFKRVATSHNPAGQGYVERTLRALTFFPDKQDDSSIRFFEKLLILHADHEQNCSTHVMRVVGSADVDPLLCAASAVGAIGGRLHGSANIEVIRMLKNIGSRENVSAFVAEVLKGNVKLVGFGHSVYEKRDPRAEMLKRHLVDFTRERGSTELCDAAFELDAALSSQTSLPSIGRFPAIEFYAAVAFDALGLPAEMFPIAFAVARTSGWAANWEELMQDQMRHMVRPRQIYIGLDPRT